MRTLFIAALLLAATPALAQWSDPAPYESPNLAPPSYQPFGNTTTRLGPGGAAVTTTNELAGTTTTHSSDGSTIHETPGLGSGSIAGPQGFSSTYHPSTSPGVTVYGPGNQVEQGYGPLTGASPLPQPLQGR